MQNQRSGEYNMDRAKAPACSSKPQSSSPLYPKPEGMGFTGLLDKPFRVVADA